MIPSASPAETALVISGGGAYGAFAVGIMKALFAGRSPATMYQPLAADVFSGTSVGAFNAAMMVSHPSDGLEAVLRLENVWVDRIATSPGRSGNGIFRVRGDIGDYFDPNCDGFPVRGLTQLAGDSLAIGRYFISRTANFLASSQPLENRAIGLLNVESFIDSSPLRFLLRDAIDPAAIFYSPKRLTITATDWITGKPASFENADFSGDWGLLAIMASAAIPGVFDPVRIGDQVYVDGGVVQNTPLDPAINLGATELHVIYLDPAPRFIPLKAQASTVDTLLRVFYMMLATKIGEDIETARWINEGIDVLDRVREGTPVNPSDSKRFIRVAGQLAKHESYHKLVVHRYFPRYALGTDLGLINFDQEQIVKLIAEGERVALNHDCRDSNCLID